MGLDMYAYVATKAKQRDEFWESAEIDQVTGQYVNPNVDQPREIAYWRKHPNLHGWMHNLWIEKGNAGDFNGDELELTWEDIDRLEDAIKNNELPGTSGFFFGDNADEYYQDDDLAFVRNARAELFLGLKVFYNSSW
jgi:hypothetical protein